MLISSKPIDIKRKSRPYSPSAIIIGYLHVRNHGSSVSRLPSCLECLTLRDRTLGIISIDTLSASGPPLFDQFEEAKFDQHFKTMAGYGHGYTRQECVVKATGYAVQYVKAFKGQTADHEVYERMCTI